MTRIYTRAGDDGETGLFGGRRVPKTDPRVEAYGTVDELNSAIGVARTLLRDPDLDAVLEQVQHELFSIGGELATPVPEDAPRPVPAVAAGHVARLESQIDRFEAEVPPLRAFILPGGDPGAAHLHLARTVCRRAERRIVALHRTEPVGADLLAYVNRLSDLLFVLARTVNHRRGVPEPTWRKP